ncbi:hypothetical protein EYF80_014556 [Liparis tanakae]|uniref:Uncharacterized protein n=1 Tax=Liparis tanakae TaxID=230148 RepID=A0A4Z2IAT8_9TELE|nr:hypothetical protein EYF80_014556 [Liparis tanakae]
MEKMKSRGCSSELKLCKARDCPEKMPLKSMILELLDSERVVPAFTADIPELSPRHPGDKPGVKLSQREPCTSRCCTCSSL